MSFHANNGWEFDRLHPLGVVRLRKSLDLNDDLAVVIDVRFTAAAAGSTAEAFQAAAQLHGGDAK